MMQERKFRFLAEGTTCGNNTDFACLNGGYCKEDGSSCNCPSGYAGRSCEKPCELECQNGATCHFVADDADSFEAQLWGKDKDGMYCKCNNGYAGLYCEYRAETCGSDEMVCLHGTQCIKLDEALYKCECPVNSNELQHTDENSNGCHQARTEFCKPTEGHVEYFGGMAVAAFCVNDGKCSDVELGGELYPVCVCPPHYTGPHCEFLNIGEDDMDRKSTDALGDDSRAIGASMVALIVFITGIGILIISFVIRQYRRHRRPKDGAVINLQGFRDNEDTVVAFSPNGSMLFPAFSPPDMGNSTSSLNASVSSNLSNSQSTLGNPSSPKYRRRAVRRIA